MAQQPYSDDVLLEALKLVEEHGTVAKAAAALDMADPTLRRRYNAAVRKAAKGHFGRAPVMPGFEITRTTSELDADGKLAREFIQQRPTAGPEFEVPEGHVVKGVSALLDPNGRELAKWVKTREDGELSPEGVADAVKDALAGYESPFRTPSAPKRAVADLLTVYPLVDWHIGLLAWARETGEDYDLKIARALILARMETLVASTEPSETAVVLGIGDMLHFDGYEHVTERSKHALDGDGRYPKVLRTALDMIFATIELALGRHKRVIVRILPGNHDRKAAIALATALWVAFRGHKRVTVDDSPSYYWWFRFGKVLLGATHGDRAKMRDLPLVMAHDRPEDWAESTYRRIYTGHIHHESRIEEGGVIVTSMRSPAARDAYHSFERYRAGRSVYSETFNIDGKEASSVAINL